MKRGWQVQALQLWAEYAHAQNTSWEARVVFGRTIELIRKHLKAIFDLW